MMVSDASEAKYPDDGVSARLFSIAITHAMHELYIYHASTRKGHGAWGMRMSREALEVGRKANLRWT